MTDPSLIAPGKLMLTFLSYLLHRAVMRNGFSDRDKTVQMNENTFIITPRGGRKGLRYCGIGLFLVRCCGNFYFKVRYCGFQSPSGVR